jgi:predicted glutamine amidotransferase
MCRMLGIVSRKPAPVDVLMAFGQLAETGRNFRDFGCPQPNPKAGHPDGWGIACVAAEGEFYARSAAKATADPKYEEAVRKIARVCSPPLTLLAHLRYASKKDTILEEYAHPFRKEVDGRVTFFAHNGEIEGFGLRDAKIDSQFIFERFLDSIGTEIRPLPDFKQAVAKAKAAIDGEFPRKVESYTFLMIDGTRLIAHRDARTCVPYYTLHETATEDARIVCSEVLPALPGRWRMLRNGEFFELAS